MSVQLSSTGIADDYYWGLRISLDNDYEIHLKRSTGLCLVNSISSFTESTGSKHGSLVELGHQGFLALMACYMFVTVREDVVGEDCVFKFCEGMYSEVWQGQPRMVVARYQANLYMISGVGR